MMPSTKPQPLPHEYRRIDSWHLPRLFKHSPRGRTSFQLFQTPNHLWNQPQVSSSTQFFARRFDSGVVLIYLRLQSKKVAWRSPDSRRHECGQCFSVSSDSNVSRVGLCPPYYQTRSYFPYKIFQYFFKCVRSRLCLVESQWDLFY